MYSYVQTFNTYLKILVTRFSSVWTEWSVAIAPGDIPHWDAMRIHIHFSLSLSLSQNENWEYQYLWRVIVLTCVMTWHTGH